MTSTRSSTVNMDTYSTEPFSQYKLRIEYRLGDQLRRTGWAYRNSGVMIHSQSQPRCSLTGLPVSIEAQFLAVTALTSVPHLILAPRHPYCDGQRSCYNSLHACAWATWHGDAGKCGTGCLWRQYSSYC